LGYVRRTIPAVLYTAKCFWPGVTEDELRTAASRAETGGATHADTAFRGALYLPHDSVVLCLFESPSRGSVKHASEDAGMPCERVIESVWVAPHERGEQKCRD
jgi:hypothetical protein